MTKSTGKGRGRERKGTVEWHDDHWDVRPTLADGSKGQRVCQAPEMSEARARDKAAAFTAILRREAANANAAALVEAPPVVSGPTLKAWCEAWCEDREKRGLTSVDDDRGRLRKWILPRLDPALGSRAAVSIDDAALEQLVEDLDARVRDEELSWKTAKNVWGLVTKMHDDMVRSKTASLRIRKDNPAKTVRGPDDGVVKSKSYLYPSEFLALVSCERVPIRWRRIFAVNVYTYTRAGELEALGLEDVDLAHRVIHVHRAIDRSDGTEKETKTNAPRRFAVEPELLPLLECLEAERSAAPRILKMPPICDLSPRLRQYLAWAGVTRASLFANDATRKQITFHDLRATGITWMAIRGDDPQRIMHRAGHENMATTMGYIREAEALAYLKTEVFPALPADLSSPNKSPEGPADWAIRRENTWEKQRPQRDSNPRQEPSSADDCRSELSEPSSELPPEVANCSDAGSRAMDAGDEGRAAAWPGLVVAAREAAQSYGGDEGALLSLWLDELEDGSDASPAPAGGSR